MRRYFFGTTISYKPYNISKIMTICPVFPDHQKYCFKEAFQNKTIILTFVSTDCKDALNAICQTLVFLLDISLKHCLFLMDNLWRFEFKWSENLAKGWSPNFPGVSTRTLLPAFPWENEQHILESHLFSTEGK